jgi:hypothetical protein
MTARDRWRQLREMFRPKGEPIWEQLARLNRAGIRRLFIQIDDECARLGLPHRIIYGAAPLDGTGEPVEDAMQKIRDNLRLIPGGRRFSEGHGNDITRLILDSSPPVDTEDGPQTAAAHAARSAGGAGRVHCDTNFYWPRPPVDKYAERNMT